MLEFRRSSVMLEEGDGDNGSFEAVYTPFNGATYLEEGKMKIFMRKLSCVCLILIMFCVASPAVFASSKININKATVTELVALKGVGEKTASNIVEYRNVHGDFKAIDEIVNVKGVGDKMFAKLADQIAVADEVAKK